MSEEKPDNTSLLKEVAYYKKRIKELTGENLRYDIMASGLKHELKQRRQGFALLSELQTPVSSQTELSSLFETTIHAVNATLGMEKSIILVPAEEEHFYRPSQWHGFHNQDVRHFSSLSLRFPETFAQGTGYLLVNRSTEVTPLIEQIRAAFELPYFICLPIMGENAPIGLILSGRFLEAKPFSPPLEKGDLDTFQAIADLIRATIRGRHLAVLKETDRLKTDFFANISHEFRTPITLSLGPLESLRKGRYGNLPSPVCEQLEVIERNQERLLTLVNQILDISKLEAGAMKLKAAKTDGMNRTVERIVEQFHSLAEERGLQLHTVLDPEVDQAELYLDLDKFDKLICNLLSNAFKFTRKGYVQVMTDIHEKNFRLTVTDTGIGIKQDELPYIFDRFRQADGSASREYAGTGIGLAWVKEIAELHGGRAAALSQYGKGSTFRVSIPLGSDHLDPAFLVKKEKAELTHSKAPKTMVVSEGASDREGVETFNQEMESSFDKAKPTVVYAEDNPDMRRYIRGLLISFYNIFLAVDGKDGLEKIKQYRPDLIIADHMMPHMSGSDLLNAIRGEPELRSIPVVFLTARAGTEARVESLESGADDYLTKPFNEDELLARVNNLIKARKQELELAVLNRRLEAKVEEQVAEIVRSGELKRFLPQGVAESLMKGKLAPKESSQRRKVTILFVDIVDFTKLTDGLEPEDLSLLLNEYLREMTAIAVSNGGTVVDFDGDAVMVLFGAPDAMDLGLQADSAVRTGMTMKKRFGELGANWRRRGISMPFNVRIGINTGYCTVGIFGSDLLKSYTAYGTPVNIAARLQTAAKPGEILCAFATYSAIQKSVKAEERPPFKLRGVAHPVEAHAILDIIES